VAGDNPHHWSFKTHKVNDPAFFGPRGAKLAFEMETTAPGNTLAVIMETDQWRGYTGRKTRRYTALVELSRAGEHGVRLPVSAFVTPEGEALDHYGFVTGLILTPGNKELPSKVKTVWQGNVPAFSNLRWEGGECAPRPKPYLGDRNGEADVDAAGRANKVTGVFVTSVQKGSPNEPRRVSGTTKVAIIGLTRIPGNWRSK